LKGLTELIQNAVDGIRSRKDDTTRGSVEIVVSDDGKQLVFRDNGIGLGSSKEEIAQKFGVFGYSVNVMTTMLLASLVWAGVKLYQWFMI